MSVSVQASLWHGCGWDGSGRLPARPREAGSHGWLWFLGLHAASAGFQLPPVSAPQNTFFGGCISRKALVKKKEKKKADALSKTAAHHPLCPAGWSRAVGRSPVGTGEAGAGEKQVWHSQGDAWAASCRTGWGDHSPQHHRERRELSELLLTGVELVFTAQLRAVKQQIILGLDSGVVRRELGERVCAALSAGMAAAPPPRTAGKNVSKTVHSFWTSPLWGQREKREVFVAVIVVPLTCGRGFLARSGLCGHPEGESWLLRLSRGTECLWSGWWLCCGVPLGWDAAVTASCLFSTDHVPPQELVNICCLENTRTLVLQEGQWLVLCLTETERFHDELGHLKQGIRPCCLPISWGFSVPWLQDQQDGPCPLVAMFVPQRWKDRPVPARGGHPVIAQERLSGCVLCSAPLLWGVCSGWGWRVCIVFGISERADWGGCGHGELLQTL